LAEPIIRSVVDWLMGMLGLTYWFPEPPPACSVLIEHISSLADEALEYDEELNVYTCPAMDNEQLWFDSIEHDGQQGYRLNSFAFPGSYLVDATITVLRAAGGSCPAPRHDVSGRSWRDAQMLYPRAGLGKDRKRENTLQFLHEAPASHDPLLRRVKQQQRGVPPRGETTSCRPLGVRKRETAPFTFTKQFVNHRGTVLKLFINRL